jgi:hypothetical protein
LNLGGLHKHMVVDPKKLVKKMEHLWYMVAVSDPFSGLFIKMNTIMVIYKKQKKHKVFKNIKLW